MVSLHSKNHTFLIGQESTFGTAVTADKDVGLVQSHTPGDKRAIEEVYASGSRQVQELVPGKSELPWDFEVDLQNGRLFEYLFGGVAHALTGSDTKHTFSITSTLPSFTMESSFNATADSVFIYDGSKITTGTVNLDTQGILKGTFSGISQSVDTSTSSASAAVISTLPVLHYKHSTLKTGTAASETSVGNLLTFNLVIDNDLKAVDQAGSVEIAELIASTFSMKFDFTMTFENTTEYEIFLGGTTPALSPTKKSALFNANNGITLGSGRREFEIQLDNFLYEEAAPATSVGDLVIASFKGTATDLGSNGCFYVDNIAAASFS